MVCYSVWNYPPKYEKLWENVHNLNPRHVYKSNSYWSLNRVKQRKTIPVDLKYGCKKSSAVNSLKVCEEIGL
jgi:hypothetical protein